jgi:hypothetical protein
MDRVFQGCSYASIASSRQYCGPVQALLDDPAPYDALYARYKGLLPYASSTCGEEVGILTGLVLASGVAAFSISVGAWWWLRRTAVAK